MKMKTVVAAEYNIVQWISEGVGVVKTENYNKKGKKVAYSLLTKYKS